MSDTPGVEKALAAWREAWATPSGCHFFPPDPVEVKAFRAGWDAALAETTQSRPAIVCLCGSTRFKDAFVDANLRETLAGRVVLSIGCDMRSDDEIFGQLTPEEFAATKTRLDALHLRKIELADEVLILNVGGYIGHSTSNELAHARSLGKVIRFLEADNQQETVSA